jgi:hypothetical protein
MNANPNLVKMLVDIKKEEIKRQAEKDRLLKQCIGKGPGGKKHSLRERLSSLLSSRRQKNKDRVVGDIKSSSTV